MRERARFEEPGVFSDASLTKNTGLVNSSRVTLNSPKATFPEHVEQPVDKTYQDYNQSGEIKRLEALPRQYGVPGKHPDKGHDNVDSTLELMRPNAEFTGKIAFHNLKAEELGALLWCLQLGEFDPKSDATQALSFPRAWKIAGAGSVRFSIKFDQLSGNLRQSTLPSAPELMSRFSSMMNQLLFCRKKCQLGEKSANTAFAGHGNAFLHHEKRPDLQQAGRVSTYQEREGSLCPKFNRRRNTGQK